MNDRARVHAFFLLSVLSGTLAVHCARSDCRPDFARPRGIGSGSRSTRDLIDACRILVTWQSGHKPAPSVGDGMGNECGEGNGLPFDVLSGTSVFHATYFHASLSLFLRLRVV